MADKGYAGGIVSYIPFRMTISNCKNWGSVISSLGNAGGIVAEQGLDAPFLAVFASALSSGRSRSMNHWLLPAEVGLDSSMR